MDNKDERMVYIGKSKINIIGLKAIFEEAKKKNFTNEMELKDFLLQKVKERNYIPESAEQEYRDSLYDEFRVYAGQLKERRIAGLIEIKILGKGCALCNRLEELTKEVLSETGIAADVEHIRDLAEIAPLWFDFYPCSYYKPQGKSLWTPPCKEGYRALDKRGSCRVGFC